MWFTYCTKFIQIQLMGLFMISLDSFTYIMCLDDLCEILSTKIQRKSFQIKNYLASRVENIKIHISTFHPSIDTISSLHILHLQDV